MISISLDSNGNASTVLTSGDLTGYIIVKATLGKIEKTILIQQTEWEFTQFDFSPREFVADGETVTTVTFSIVQQGTTDPVQGHTITFGIDSIYDSDGNPVDQSNWGDYGTFLQTQAVTDSNGTATIQFQAGTLPGTIYLYAEDNNVWEP